MISTFNSSHDSSSINFVDGNIVEYTEYTKLHKDKYLKHIPDIPEKSDDYIETLWVKNGKHHLFHACSAVFSDKVHSNKCYAVVLDGFGNYSSAKVFEFKNNQVKTLYTANPDLSVGIIWNTIGVDVFDYKNILNHGKNGTMMARAGLGKVDVDILTKLKMIHNNTEFSVNRNVFDVGNTMVDLAKVYSVLNLKNIELTEKYKNNLCATLQHFTNLETLKLFKMVPVEAKRVYFAGGVAHNVTAIKYVEDKLGIEIFTGFAQGDEGISLGYACYQHYIVNKNVYNPTNYRLPYSSNEKCNMSSLSEMNNMLNKYGIIINYMGSPEIGSRALGHRSFIANPTISGMKTDLDILKKRETFRPYGVMVRFEDVEEYFKENIESPYMNKIATPNDKFKSLMSKFVHLDGTVRVQTIDKHISPEMHDLLTYRKVRGDVPVLVNTSLNINTPMLYKNDEKEVLKIMEITNTITYIDGKRV